MPALVRLWGQKGLVLASPSANEKVLPQCGIDLLAQGILRDKFCGECCEDELARVAALVTREHVDVLVGMGGGKTIDTAKIVADRAGIPVMVIPTIASTDAPCSGCAVVYSATGIFERVCYQKSNPAAVLVDVGIIATAPTRFLAAEKTCAADQPIHHEAGEITAPRVLDAMLAADAVGKQRQTRV